MTTTTHNTTEEVTEEEIALWQFPRLLKEWREMQHFILNRYCGACGNSIMTLENEIAQKDDKIVALERQIASALEFNKELKESHENVCAKLKQKEAALEKIESILGDDGV